jgi:hypothetical protein
VLVLALLVDVAVVLRGLADLVAVAGASGGLVRL